MLFNRMCDPNRPFERLDLSFAPTAELRPMLIYRTNYTHGATCDTVKTPIMFQIYCYCKYILRTLFLLISRGLCS